MIELAEKLSGKEVKNLLNLRRNFVWEAEVTWCDTKDPTEKPVEGIVILFTDIIVLTKFHKKKQKIVFQIPFFGLVPKFQGDAMNFRYDSLKTHLFEVKFKTNAAAITTKQKLDALLV